MKKHLSAWLTVLVLLTGICLLLYPTVGNTLHGRRSTMAIGRYTAAVNGWESGDIQAALFAAERYNSALFLGDVSASDYDSLLNPDGDGMMGCLDIPKIGCHLPVCHGTDAPVLESYVGHLPSSSLPVGGANTHCVLTGHTGLPSAKLLTDLNRLSVGDTFTLTVFDRMLSYEVDQILVVLPDETDALRTVEGEDYCTLVTCTPYGVNSHRLLVRGRRTAEKDAQTIADGFDPLAWLAANPVVAALGGLLLILLIALAVTRKNHE